MASKNKHLQSTTPIEWPIELLKLVKQKAKDEDENTSSLIRRVMADYVGWKGKTRNMNGYSPESQD